MGLFEFQYFDERVAVEIPGELLIDKIEPEVVTALYDVCSATEEALSNPVGAPTIEDSISKNSKVLVVVPDKSRHTNLREVVRVLLSRIDSAGAKREDITILIATGTHRPMTEAEIAQKYSDVLEGYSVVNHVYDDESTLVDLGTTKDGLPVQFNRLILEHDFIVSVGNIGPHPVGGYSGGAKGLLPGIAGKRSTDYFHWEATNHPLFDVFGNADNPIRREMEEIVAETGLSFIVNTTENADREISGVFAGHYVEAHRKGVEFLKKTSPIAYPVSLPDILVVGLGLDRPDLWGGAAGIYLAAALLKAGGILVLFAKCPEGVANNHPVVLEHGYRDWRRVREMVMDGKIADRTGASHIVTVGKILEEKDMKVILVSGSISKEDAERLGFIGADRPQEAVDMALSTAENPGVLIYWRI
ncbi:MAG: nickel-dependent lactate racemase [Deltaproteobacteria bacterium]|uniref:Nickel-dependent lactate racemase n=1 Tax=Candidatus Zymogenus saltonus TaxID=2844893 RepID=A0A9D8PSH7_9DELT|nr:nickel-dependent lactate racemase [Candidatus Zymogenus saltonus]